MATRTERLHGTLTAWDDDRGFGFITPDSGTGKTFVHIKAFPSRPTRPHLGEALTFEVEQSADGKRQAARVRPAGQRMPSPARRPTSRQTARQGSGPTSRQTARQGSGPTSRQTARQGSGPTSRQRSQQSSRSSAHRTVRATAYLPILLFVIGYLVVNAYWPISLWVAGFYLAISLICFLFYAADKSAATANRWRISENTLLLWGVVGGWPGAIVAQQTLRHKTQKASFRSVFWFTVGLNVIVFAIFATPAFTLFAEWTTRPPF